MPEKAEASIPPLSSSNLALPAQHGPRQRRSYTALPKLSTITPHLPSFSKQQNQHNQPPTSAPVIEFTQSPTSISIPYKTEQNEGARKQASKHRVSKSLVVPSRSISKEGGDVAILNETLRKSAVSRAAKETGEEVVVLSNKSEDRDKKIRQAREAELRNSYNKLRTFYKEMDMHVDNIYYSVLDRLSALGSAVTGLQELSAQNMIIKSKFERQSQDIENDVNKQIENYNDFKRPQERVEALESRMRKSKNRAEILNKRLDIARQKAKELESKEEVVQATIAFRFRLIWLLLAAVIALIFGVGFHKAPQNSLSKIIVPADLPPLPNLLKKQLEVAEVLSAILPSNSDSLLSNLPLSSSTTSSSLPLYALFSSDPNRIFSLSKPSTMSCSSSVSSSTDTSIDTSTHVSSTYSESHTTTSLLHSRDDFLALFDAL